MTRSYASRKRSITRDLPRTIGMGRTEPSMVHLSTNLAGDTIQAGWLAETVGAERGRSRCVNSVETMTKSVLEAVAVVVAVAGNSSNFDSLEFAKQEKKIERSDSTPETFDILRLMQYCSKFYVSSCVPEHRSRYFCQHVISFCTFANPRKMRRSRESTRED